MKESEKKTMFFLETYNAIVISDIVSGDGIPGAIHRGSIHSPSLWLGFLVGAFAIGIIWWICTLIRKRWQNRKNRKSGK